MSRYRTPKWRGSSLLGFRKIVADEIKSGEECLSLIPPE
jgi:hypothetical protein